MKIDFFDELCSGIPGVPDSVGDALKQLTWDCPSNPKFLEVGSWKGRSSCYLAAIAKVRGGHLTCIDHWQGSLSSIGGSEIVDGGLNLYEEFLSNLTQRGLREYITPLKMSSEEASLLIPDESQDLIFIDADHLYPSIKRDLELWFPKVKTGGIFCGHDAEFYYSEKADRELNLSSACTYSYHPGVITALFEKFDDKHNLIKGAHV